MLALSLARESNFLVLDEPTNDLDMETLDLLQEVLDEYQGTILLVSHDRDFLDKITTSMLYMPGDGTVIEHVGNYDELYNKYIAPRLKNTKISNEKIKKEAGPRITAKPQKLSYKAQRLYEILPEEISEIEQKISEIEEKLSDANLYIENQQEFYHLTEQLDSLKREKDAKETEWLEIDMQKNSLN